MGSAKIWFEFVPIFSSCIIAIPFPEFYLVLSSFIDNVISQVDILLIRLGIKSCGRNISQLIKFVEKLSIGASTSEVICLTTSSRLGSIWGVIFPISVEEILEYAVGGILYVVSVWLRKAVMYFASTYVLISVMEKPQHKGPIWRSKSTICSFIASQWRWIE